MIRFVRESITRSVPLSLVIFFSPGLKLKLETKPTKVNNFSKIPRVTHMLDAGTLISWDFENNRLQTSSNEHFTVFNNKNVLFFSGATTGNHKIIGVSNGLTHSKGLLAMRICFTKTVWVLFLALKRSSSMQDKNLFNTTPVVSLTLDTYTYTYWDGACCWLFDLWAFPGWQGEVIDLPS